MTINNDLISLKIQLIEAQINNQEQLKQKELQQQKEKQELKQGLKQEISDLQKNNLEERKLSQLQLNRLQKQLETLSNTFSNYMSNISPLQQNIDGVKSEMNNLKQDQSLQQKQWARNNPLINDDPIYEWFEQEVSANSSHSFTYPVPEGNVFYLSFLSVNYNKGTTYEILLDVITHRSLSDAVIEFGSHIPLFTPPKLIYKNVIIKVTNNQDTAQTYRTLFSGFLRTVDVQKAYKTPKEYKTVAKEGEYKKPYTNGV